METKDGKPMNLYAGEGVKIERFGGEASGAAGLKFPGGQVND